MIKLTVCLMCFILFSAISGYPSNEYRRPQRTVMFGGYYGHPSNSRSSYLPQGSMTAFASGDTIATNSFVGEAFPDENSAEYDVSAEETTEKRKSVQELPVNPGLDEDSVYETDVSSPKKPKRIPKRKPQKPQKEEEEDDEELPSSWPFSGGRNGVPSYNAFFPIMIGGLSGSKTRSTQQDEGYYPGAATAIANSFSTGKGGVATSHATSFGDPYLSSLLRNAMFNRKMKSYREE